MHARLDKLTYQSLINFRLFATFSRNDHQGLCETNDPETGLLVLRDDGPGPNSNYVEHYVKFYKNGFEY
jgi:hypothetical protein